MIFRPKMVHLSGMKDWMPRIVRLVEANLKRGDIDEYGQFIKLTPAEKREYVLRNWEDLSIQADPECVKKMNRTLHPLLENTVKKGAVEEIKTHFVPMLTSATKSTIDLHIDMSRAPSNVPDRTDTEAAQSLLVSYLNLFAGVYCAQVDMLVWANILSGKDYYRLEKGRRIPRKMERLAEVRKELDRHKLAYLSSEGFQSVTEACDKDLRNAIAHNDYDILDEIGISYSSTALKTRVTLDLLGLREKHLRLKIMIGCINESMTAFYVDWASREIMNSMPDSVLEALSGLLTPDYDDNVSDDSDK